MAATKRQNLIGHKVSVLSGAGAPVNGTSGTGAGRAVPGSFYIDTTASNSHLWINRGTKASPTWDRGTKVVVLVAAGVAAAGPVTLTGAVVGDTVVGVVNLTDAATGVAAFETAITVANQIQQSSASNLTSKTYFFVLTR